MEALSQRVKTKTPQNCEAFVELMNKSLGA